MIAAFLVYSSPKEFDAVMEPEDGILFLQPLLEHSDETVVADNKTLSERDIEEIRNATASPSILFFVILFGEYGNTETYSFGAGVGVTYGIEAGVGIIYFLKDTDLNWLITMVMSGITTSFGLYYFLLVQSPLFAPGEVVKVKTNVAIM